MKSKLYNQFYDSIHSIKKSNIKNPKFMNYVEKQIQISHTSNKITDYERSILLSCLRS